MRRRHLSQMMDIQRCTAVDRLPPAGGCSLQAISTLIWLKLFLGTRAHTFEQ